MKYVVEGQHIRPYGKPHELASDSIEFIEVEFSFSKEWDGMHKTAQFIQMGRTYNRTLVDDKCKLPVEVTDGPFKISVFGYTDTGARGTTVPVCENLRRSGFVPNGEDIIPPTPDLYAQLIGDFNTAIRNSVPYIGENGNWWVWDVEVGEYVDTGKLASTGKGITVDPTLTMSGQAADAAVTGGKISKLFENIANQSGSSTVNPVPFKVQEIGQLFDQPLPYTAWCSGSLHYDASLGKYVDLLYCAPQHESPEYTASYVTHIDPKTYEASDPVLCKFYDTDGTTELSITYAGKPAFVILQDGTYMILQSIGGTTYRFISVDYGLTWVKGGACSGYTISTETYALVQLSNGRILANAITREINYSDDGGITWTSVTPATSGASYEAEYCFLEVKPSVVLGICRKTVSGVGNGVSAVSGDCEHAVYTISEDYGTTWSVLKESETIDNMNASTCTGYVHDGVVEIFAASRWYHDGDYATTDYTNTGKSGAITHYMATVENALNDKFTNMGVIVYAKTTGDTSPLAAQDFHTPCIAVNGTDMLMVYFDRVEPYNVADTVNHHYIRGSLNGIDYGVRDNLKSTIFPVSSAKVDALIRKAKNEMIIKINEAILSGGLIPPTDGDDPGTFVFDGIVANFNFTDESTMDAEAMTVTDTINGIAATCTSETFPTVRENSVSGGTFSIPALSDYFDSTTSFAFTVEISIYREDGDSWHKYDFWSAYSNGGARNRFAATIANLHAINTSGSAVTYAQWATINPEATGHNHVVGTFSEDGTFCIYRNGELQATYNSFADFASWPETVLTKASWVGEKLKAFRIYKRALTAEEVATNYAYEKATIV